MIIFLFYTLAVYLVFLLIRNNWVAKIKMGWIDQVSKHVRGCKFNNISEVSPYYALCLKSVWSYNKMVCIPIFWSLDNMVSDKKLYRKIKEVKLKEG